MRKICTLFLLFSGLSNFAQDDVGITGFTAPLTPACSYTTTEPVTISLFNFGPTDLSGVPMDLTYRLNATPFTDLAVSFPLFPSLSFVTYTFSTTADLSAPGSYTLDAYVVLSIPDANALNDSIIGFTVLNNMSFGGTIAPAAITECSGSNSGALTLSGQFGAVLDWESSIDGGFTWLPLGNLTTVQTYLNLVTTTWYRVIVQNGICPPDTSAISIVTVVGPSVGGTVLSDDTVCATANTGTLFLVGSSGAVVKWEFSIDGGFSWSAIANTTTSHTYTNLTVTTMFRALCQVAPCSDDTSTAVTITVDAAPVGGTVTASAIICQGNNSGTLTLAGHSGTIVRWEFSTDGGFTWSPIANTTTTQSYLNLVMGTMYRAVISNGVCPNANSVPATLSVTPPPAPGIVSATQTVCTGVNSGTLTLTGHTGSVVRWEFSTNGGFTWTPIVNVTTSQAFLNLVATRQYRAIITNGICPNVPSVDATVFVSPVAVGGTVSASATVCAPTNSGVLTLAGHTGTIGRWEYSTDGGFTWVNITNTTTSYTYSNLLVTTRFRAFVQNGACSAFSVAAIITVNPASVGGMVTSDATVCESANGGTLTLSGHTGAVTGWQFSVVSPTGPWTPISNTTTTQTYVNLTQTTYYTAIVQSGACATATSAVATITVDPIADGGTLTADDTVCAVANNGTLTLMSMTGNILFWEYSVDGGFTWINISNTNNTHTYNNLSVTTMYRVLVQSGVCGTDTSNRVTITVDPMTNPGMVTSNATVCFGSNNGTVTLSGYTGTVVSWLFSTVSSTGPWNVIGNTTNSQLYFNLTMTTYYAAIVQSGICGQDTSSVAVITVDPLSVSGSLAVSDTVCFGNNNDTLVLSGNTGLITNWTFSIDGGFTWVDISNPSTTQIYNNLTVTTMYVVIVQSGVCPADTSNTVIITVTPASNGGAAGPNLSVCEINNNDSVMLTGYTGSILNWLSSTTGPNGPWVSIANTTSTQTFSGLTQTTWYAAVVQSGGCVSDTSSSAMVTVNPKPVASFTASADTICLGASITFNNTTTIPSGFIQTYSWDLGDGNTLGNMSPVVHTYLVADTFTVSLFAVSDQGCLDTALMTILVNGVPSAAISAGSATTFCFGDSVILTAPAGPDLAYFWLPDSLITQSIVADSSSWYIVTVTDTLTGCLSSDSIEVIVNSLPIVDAGNDTTISLGTVITLNGSGNGSYSWVPVSVSNPFILDPTAQPTATTSYILTVTDVNGCVNSDTVTITVNADYIVTVMNLLTPNGDGFNDTWVIDGILFYSDNDVSIFNRNGKLVYNKSGYDNTWSGTYKDMELPDGAYYYVVTFTGSEKVYKGTVTVLRSK